MANLQLLKENVTQGFNIIKCSECGNEVGISNAWSVFSRSFCSIGCADISEEKNQGHESINNLGEWE